MAESSQKLAPPYHAKHAVEALIVDRKEAFLKHVGNCPVRQCLRLVRAGERRHSRDGVRALIDHVMDGRREKIRPCSGRLVIGWGRFFLPGLKRKSASIWGRREKGRQAQPVGKVARQPRALRTTGFKPGLMQPPPPSTWCGVGGLFEKQELSKLLP